ncbi:hypothetical protein DCAR_0625785 [Daucus carota subsp. sativus]|uniref:Uncharacterized protein n=1 Tax=Daucus carota subsp. sativus TaxID=79200 RepID=A0A161YGB1_DAUCS|nr:PREDICTED: sulfoquinovosidase-like [Daucus carota subsp. sativus]WOH06359.1 hypothetical protein DCAR_0625785 [Daucus carota subsp. sativus]
MTTLRIRKKHNHHLNNPFTSNSKSLPFVQGPLFLNRTVPYHQTFLIGDSFLLTWASKDGGSISISHQSQPRRSIWATVPGQAFVSAALAETQVDESRGSFVIKDRNIQLVCNCQTVEDVRMINEFSECFYAKDGGFLSGVDQKMEFKNIEYPALLIMGRIFSFKKKKKMVALSEIQENLHLLDKEPSSSARYWLLFDQKNSNQLAFQLRLGKSVFRAQQRVSPRIYKGFTWRLRPIWRRRRKRGFIAVTSAEEDVVVKTVEPFDQFNRVCLTYSSEKNERFYGFGEQFSHMNFKGKRVPIIVQEQGIGRGDQPITFAANLISYRSGGDWSTTYAPSPLYMTSKMRSLYLEGYDYSVFDLTRDDRVQIQIYGGSAEGRILNGNSPCELIECLTESIGRPPKLPDWIISGPVVGMQGGTATVRNVWEELNRYEVPVSAFWLQDWVGQRKTVIGSQLWWNWEVDAERYRGWQNLIKDLTSEHIKVMTYCNPCLAPMDGKANVKRNLFEEAKKLGILVRDSHGEPYMVPNTAFDVGMLDLTHPHTASWFKQVLQEMINDGVSGWMADFGEGLPVDACLYSGEDPISAHNRYPEMWAKLNRDFVEEWKTKRAGVEHEGSEEDLVFFMRAGFRNSPKWAMLFWEGDQMVSWQANDGIKSSVVGLLSSGISGYAYNHSDIGGYCAVKLPFCLNYTRSEELLLRWMELNAFTSVFRTHEGNKPSSNSQFYSNHKTLSHFARLAKMYKAWKFYRIQLVKEASQKGLPVCRHLFLHYPDDDYVHSLTYEQFLVGTEILVVPVLDKGKKKVKAYFPIGEQCPWKHIWTGNLYTEQGSKAWIEAPIDYPAIFVKDGSVVGDTFLKNLKDYNIL